MTRMGRMLVLIVLVVAGHVSLAARVEFSGSENRAILKTELINARSSSLPSVDYDLTIPAIEVERESSGFDKLQVKGLSPSPILGNPEILVTGSLLAVPAGFEPELEIIRIEEKDLNGVRVRPSQQEWRCSGPKASFTFNSALYATDSVYPHQSVQLEEVGKMAGVRLVRVAIQPLRMEMKSERLKVAHQIQFRVNFKSISREVRNQEVPQSVLETLVAGTANGKSLARSFRSSERAERMVIVTADSFKNALAPFIAWKKKRGMEVDVVTLTQAGGNKEEVQKYIKAAYDKAAVKPSYLLFVGNKDSMPAFKESTGSGSAASDYRMTLLVGDDAIPDVFYGRFLADTEEELKTQIQRTIEYEKAPNANDWLSHGMTIASDEGSNPSDEGYALEVQEALKTGNYKALDSFFQGKKTATSANILKALSEGRSWIAYFGHGSGTSWGSVNDKFSVATIANVENSQKLPVMIDVACLNASWMNIPKCFGKAWMTQTNANGPTGTVAYYGGSVSISWHPPAIMSVGIAKHHATSGLKTIGSTVIAGQLYLLEKMGETSAVTDNMKWYNLFGDPSLSVRTN